MRTWRGESGSKATAKRVLRPAACVALLLLAGLPAYAQDASQMAPPDPGGTPQESNPGRHGAGQSGASDDDAGFRTAVRLSQLRAARQKALIAEADKLVKLAAALNAEVGGAGAAPLTKAQLREANEIEKLARSVERDMKMPASLELGRPSAQTEQDPRDEGP